MQPRNNMTQEPQKSYYAKARWFKKKKEKQTLMRPCRGLRYGVGWVSKCRKTTVQLVPSPHSVGRHEGNSWLQRLPNTLLMLWLIGLGCDDGGHFSGPAIPGMLDWAAILCLMTTAFVCSWQWENMKNTVKEGDLCCRSCKMIDDGLVGLTSAT